MERVTVTRPTAPIRATIRLPRSKSISNRALVCASLAGDPSCVRDLSEAEDTVILHRLLIERPAVMHCGLGGTTLRFLLAWASVQEGEERLITGEPRLLERPHDDLVNALIGLGADIEREANGYRVRGRILRGGTITLGSPISSQYISALMMVAPLLRDGLRIEWTGRRLSEPYVRMTAKVMAHFGVESGADADAIVVPPGRYHANVLTVPPDWSAAAFWYEAVGLAGDADILLEGLHIDGGQGDERIDQLTRRALVALDEEKGVRLRSLPAVHQGSEAIDLTDQPDLFQPLACLFAGLDRSIDVRGIDNLRTKESDRIEAVAIALRTLGMRTAPRDDRYAHWPVAPMRGSQPPAFDPMGDHRMAMALAPLALVCDRITILDPGVVKKSYPTYWEDLREAGFGITFS